MTDIVGRAKVIVESALDKNSFTQSGEGIGGIIRKGALGGIVALGALTAEGIRSAKAFEEAEVVSRKLNNVLDNMGKTKAHEAVDQLANSIMRATGVDDELIKGGQTILATFSQVAESAGDVGGTFDRATRAAVDLAAAGFGNIESASVMLGKALQDPVKGVSALGEAGVTFSEDQKKMIEALVKTGDVGKAQNIILKEVERQVKGTAEAGKSGSKTIGTAFGELEESFGHVLSTFTGKDGFDSIADAIFNLSEELDKFAKSDSWEQTVDDLKNVGGAARDAYEWLDKVVHVNPTPSPRPGVKGDKGENILKFDLGDGAHILDTAYQGFDKFNLYLHDKWGADVKESFGDSWESFKGYIHEKAGDSKHDFRVWFSEPFSEIGKSFKDSWGDFKKDASKKFSDLKKQIRDVPKDIKSKANEWYDAGAKLLKEFGRGLGAGARSLATDFGQWIKDGINSALGLPRSINIPSLKVGSHTFGGGSITIDALRQGGYGDGPTLVGEDGPEIVDLPSGSRVSTAGVTRSRLAEGARESAQIIQNNTYIFNGSESFAQARRNSDWAAKNGTRFGAATRAVTA